MRREDIQNECRSVYHLRPCQFGKVSHLGSSQLVVADDTVGFMDLYRFADLFSLALPDICRFVGMNQVLHHFHHGLSARGVQKIPKLVKRVPCGLFISRCHRDKYVFFRMICIFRKKIVQYIFAVLFDPSVFSNTGFRIPTAQGTCTGLFRSRR